MLRAELKKCLSFRVLWILLFCLLYLIAIAGCVLSAIALEHEFDAPPVIAGLVVSIIWLCIGWVPFLGLKVLKPQEALVLTLFGNYIGTLKEAGFYFVNPFCTSVNPASKTKLSQSGDVDNNSKKGANLSSLLGVSTTGTTEESSSKKISLKVMTLNNSRQKINDCLGNPIEIGIAVTWRVVDTAKAVFNVDNYKEYLSLQCDGALRNIVRIYPYDTAPDVDTTGDGKADVEFVKTSSGAVKIKVGTKMQDVVLSNGDSGYIVSYSTTDYGYLWDDSRDYLWPIPAKERTLNPNLSQNEGYVDGIDS